jgi:hypothetical protein
MRTPRAADRPDGVTLLDKYAFFTWADEQHRLEANDMRVLRVIVFELLGLEDGKAFNGWSTIPTLAWMCGTTERSVHRSLGKLKKLGLVKTTGFRGCKGRTVLHVPSVVGAAQSLARRKLSDKPPPGDEALAKTRRPRHVSDDANMTQLSPETRRRRQVNPLKNPLDGYEPSERAPGAAASRPGDPLFESGLGEEEGAYGGASGEDEVDALTLPRRRLKRRLAGAARKLGLQDAGEGLLAASDEDTVLSWLRLQSDEEACKREGKPHGGRLFKALTVALVDHYKLNDKQAGRKLAAKAEPEPPEAKPPAPPASPPSPPPRPQPAWGGPRIGIRDMGSATHEPEHNPAPRKPYVCSDEAMRASVARLKGYA